MADINAIRKRCDAATPGPWVVATNGPRDVVITQPIHEMFRVAFREDAEFIAHARTDIPALLARVRELEAAMQRVRNAVAGDPTSVARAGAVMHGPHPDGVDVTEAADILAEAVIAVDDALQGSDV